MLFTVPRCRCRPDPHLRLGIIRRHRAAIGSPGGSSMPGSSPARARPPAQRRAVYRGRGRVPGRHPTAWRCATDFAPPAARAPKLRQAVRAAKKAGYAQRGLLQQHRHPDPGRPGCRGPALLLRQTRSMGSTCRSSPAPAATSCGCPGAVARWSTTRRPSGSGPTCTWRPPGRHNPRG